jgi:hypothetical protein
VTGAPNPHAARARLSRERKKRGDVILTLELPSPTVDELVALGWIADDLRADKAAVLDAFCRFSGRALALKIRPAAAVKDEAA